ncbi:TM2 domain-containing protein [Candidatus Neptunichlamydia sp. REUL1]|uniref:TM2 domain-containing protein n=1 Tax=Candidatus Neptunichlamydia sp. REUL1 TaxID=3064277 RepID=UPI0029318138|nr:TM2 domain-containing protein [Candidatus Neptunochlamydia sp. REUL1]
MDYKAQVLLSMFLGMFGANHFYAGNHEEGVTPLLGTAVLIYFGLPTLSFILTTISLLQLNEGNYTDSDGKVIRQVVQLKKEEISSTDQKTTLILCSFLGFFGAHQFYTGKPLKGVLMLCSLGGLLIWSSMNLYQIATCDFRDGEDKVLCHSYIKANHGM